MDSERRNGYKRNSREQPVQGHPVVERRSSKKSSSQDRHGKIYPDSFSNRTIRTVTPESPSENSHAVDPRSQPTSPRSGTRQRFQERAWEHGPSASVGTVPTVDDDLSTSGEGSLRSRSRTLEEPGNDSSPNSFISRTRQRLGSIHTSSSGAVSQKNNPDDPVSSIGFPSIHSPSYPGQGPRQRLVKNHPGSIVTPSLDSSSLETSGHPSPLHYGDTNKILQLMKTTCGRMHGILSFRTASTGTWTSGYCAINVATGSLIYQAKGEPALAKTLIPDLRGCHVRTLFDSEMQLSYLSVSTHSSGLGIQLRPHVPETFDSWLAALLCWQPLRPKGVQNKMTKPQSFAIGSRPIGERRRNSETATRKDAAIIKVGNMLYWDKYSNARPPASPPSKRISTFKQQRAASSSWHRVSCTLQENGHFKLYTEGDVNLITCIQLSQLSRCAVQQLEPSVLDDEFCIAIYPQYTAQSGSQVLSRPIFLSLETRVLFEVWFVLLRAFTVPELYGPEQPSDEADSGKGLPSSTTDMFRVERMVSIKMTEAKMVVCDSPVPSRPKKQSQKTIIPPKEALIGDYYAEIQFDGEVRAKTAVKMETSNPFWREEFEFHDLPPVLSSASVVVKTQNPAQRDWTLIAHGPYAIGHGDSSPMTVVGDIEISSHDTSYGKIDLRLDDLDSGIETEKWWPILDDSDQFVGEMLMKVRLEETVVLMSQDYQGMSELLHSFNNSLTVQMSKMIPTELRRLSETLLNIFQVSASVGDWVMALVEDEIDGVARETAATRLRYSSRIHSNDSHESGSDRELFVRDMGRSATVEANLLFRGNSLLTKSLDSHMRRLGKDYLEDTLGERLRDIDESDPECEVDPNRLQSPEDLDRNWRNLLALTGNMWKSIHASASRCPSELRLVFRHIRACAEDRYGDYLRTVTYSSVSGFLFLRFFCPAILNPQLFGLLKEHPRPRAQRTLTLIAKSLQGLANMSTFGSKEPWMEPMNRFLASHKSEFKSFVDSICSIPAERSTQAVSPSYATPIQILARLPHTSREGFPSLPFLIDHPRSFATLITLWLESTKNLRPDVHAKILQSQPHLLKFHTLCLELSQKTKDCLNKAEQAERPTETLEPKWEELVEQMERSSTFYDDAASKPTTPSADSMITALPNASNAPTPKRHSMGYFARPTPPAPPSALEDEDEETSTSSASATWDQSRLPFSSSAQAKKAVVNESTSSSKNSSQYSLDPLNMNTNETSVRLRNSPATGKKGDRDKYRFFDFVGAAKKGGSKKGGNAKGVKGAQGDEEGSRNEF